MDSSLAKSAAAMAMLIGAICVEAPSAQAVAIPFSVTTSAGAFAAGEDAGNPGTSLAGQASASFNASGPNTGSHFLTTGVGAVATGTFSSNVPVTSAVDHAGVINGPTSRADAAADLATGSVHLYASGNNSCDGFCGPNSIVTNTTESALASYFDTLHFTVAGAGANTVTPITVTFNFDGSFNETFIGRGAETADFAFDDLTNHHNAGVTYDTDLPPNTGGGVAVIANSQFSGWVSGQWLTLSTTLAQFQGVFNLIGASDDIHVGLQAGLTCVDGITCDFLNTGSVGLVLPNNVSFTSASGVFLSGQAGPGGPPGGPNDVAEPSSLLALGSGLAWFAAGRRNRYARQAMKFS